MRIRILVLAAAAVSLLAVAAPASAIPSVDVVIHELQTRGTNGGFDEFVQLRNNSPQAINITGWRVFSCSGTTGQLSQSLFTVGQPPAGEGEPFEVVLEPGESFLAANDNSSTGGYDGPVPPQQFYGRGVADTGGIALFDNGVRGDEDQPELAQDRVGYLSGSECTETAPTAPNTANVDVASTRDGNVVPDTDVNARDFRPAPSTPERGGEQQVKPAVV